MSLIRVTVNGKLIQPFQRQGKYVWKCELTQSLRARVRGKTCGVCAPRSTERADAVLTIAPSRRAEVMQRIVLERPAAFDTYEDFSQAVKELVV